MSVGIILLVSAACFPFAGFLDYKIMAFFFLATLSFLSLFFEILPVLLAAVVSTLIWNFFFIPPRFTFHIHRADDYFLLIMYFIIAFVHAVLTYKIRQLEKENQKKEEKTHTLKLYNTLLNSLSHELRTPIATIIGATDNLLMESNKLSEENKMNLLSEISVASLRLNQQVENLLNMSRLESGNIQIKKDWCDANELVYTAIKRLEENYKKRIIQVQLQDNLPLFRLDAGLLEQVIYNLVYNAIIYTPDDAVVKISVASVANSCVIIVEDNGNGFPEEEINNVFEKFYRLKDSKVGGTGLGLSIAKGFIEAHKGYIVLENLNTGGAKFTITIPTETSYLNDLKND
ncbi:MAG: ATP-binding protein [Ferruginibacter sp.]